MPKGYKGPEEFDLKLAVECAEAFAGAVEVGCTISTTAGAPLHEVGAGCGSCQVCAAVGRKAENCIQAHIYGMTEAERFGGKYIYFCPMGLTCFVSPILGQAGSAAKITVGPFRMVDREDYVAYELQEKLRLTPEEIGRVYVLLDGIPYVPPQKVQAMSNLLFMAVGFLNKVSAANRMLDAQAGEQISGQISAYILELKMQEDLPRYPVETERALVASIIQSDKPKAQKLLNELLGFVLFSSGGDLGRIKTRIYELLVVISRAAIDAGASPERSYQLNHDFITRSQALKSTDELYFLITEAMNQYIDSVFDYRDVKHVDVIHKAVNHILRNYARKLTLEEVAEAVYLSPSYFSKVFKQEMGCNFNAYLNELRIEKSKALLLENLKLVEVATLVGFEDQSYFTKVFKRVTGTTPNLYRERSGKA